MKNSFVVLLFLTIALTACVKDKDLISSDQISPNIIDLTRPAQQTGTMMSGSHPTSGTVSVRTGAQKPTDLYLVFENFKTDPGPDLRVYLAEDQNAGGFVELATLDKTGNFHLAIPANTDLQKKKFVLIWCKRFKELFGSAELKKQ
jgi:hypothetical protein